MSDPTSEKPPDWQMPPGVDGGLWDYLHSRQVATGYEASLAGSSLFTLDVAFVREFCPNRGRVIDLGCGTGRVLRTLADDGYIGTGVDLSPEMLRVARLQSAGKSLDWIAANLTDLRMIPEATFDHAVCLFSTLGMIRGAEHRESALAEAYRVLRPGGRFVLHVHNRWWRLFDPAGRSWLLSDFLGRRDRDLEVGDHRMPVHQGVAGLVLHLFTRGEIVQMLCRVGFSIVEVRPISLADDGRLPWPGLFPSWRAYGFLIAAEKPNVGTKGSGSSPGR